MKRQDYISWDEYFMGVALLAAKRSKDPNTQVGACIVSKDNVIISTGYNGFPYGCSDDEYPWDREGDFPKPNTRLSCTQSLMRCLTHTENRWKTQKSMLPCSLATNVQRL